MRSEQSHDIRVQSNRPITMLWMFKAQHELHRETFELDGSTLKSLNGLFKTNSLLPVVTAPKRFDRTGYVEVDLLADAVVPTHIKEGHKHQGVALPELRTDVPSSLRHPAIERKLDMHHAGRVSAFDVEEPAHEETLSSNELKLRVLVNEVRVQVFLKAFSFRRVVLNLI